jgi:glycosyltransferase involved in cell wall biosynthesis
MGTKYRLRVWGERMRGRGHDVVLSEPVPGGRGEELFARWTPRDRAQYHVAMLRSRVADVARAPGFHVAVVHMTDLPHWEYGRPFVARALARTAGRLVVDLDDLPVVRSEASPPARARHLVAAADGLVLGNGELRTWFPGRPAWMVPTCVEPSQWPMPDRAAREGPVGLGWVGTAGGLRELEALAPVLAQVCADGRARVRVVCDARPCLPAVPADFAPWSAEREVGDVLAFDVGLAPLSDDPVSRCKCGLKALQTMAAGAPVVASPVGALREIVVPGQTGLHAASAGEWGAALARLVADRPLRLGLGNGARAAVERRWSFDVHEARFESALRGIET